MSVSLVARALEMDESRGVIRVTVKGQGEGDED